MRPTLKRVVMWLFHKYNNVGEPLEVRDKVTGKDVANMLDTIVFYGIRVITKLPNSEKTNSAISKW
jgi:hypothetical protein